MSKKVCVVIPIHTSHPSKGEMISFARCFEILSEHDIVVIHPEGLDLSVYESLNKGFKNIPLNAHWQSSLANYNILKCSIFFYNIFSNYDYLLTYELDAYVFRDELSMWCDKDYDYIGAPWFDKFSQATPPYKLIGVGNSGFSLRKVKSCRHILNRIAHIKFLYKVYNKTFSSNFNNFIELRILKNYFKIHDTKLLSQILNNYNFNEDIFWASVVANTFTDFTVAPYEDAIKFSFEVCPRYLYELNNYALPFGCHAWQKYDPVFWETFIN